MKSLGIIGLVLVIFAGISVRAQTPAYPDKIRGYKVERTVVVVFKP